MERGGWWRKPANDIPWKRRADGPERPKAPRALLSRGAPSPRCLHGRGRGPGQPEHPRGGRGAGGPRPARLGDRPPPGQQPRPGGQGGEDRGRKGNGREAAPRPGVLLDPDLGNPLRAETSRSIVLFLTAWPSAERPGIEALVEVVRDGRVLRRVPAGRHEAGPDGRLQLASSLPLRASGRAPTSSA